MKKKIVLLLVVFGLLITSIASAGYKNIENNMKSDWEAEIWITEIDGRHDYVIIGEKLDATDGIDIGYDVPKCPPPPSLFVQAYIYHEEFPFPYECLWFEYRNSTEDVYKEWELCSIVFIANPTEVTISWNRKDFYDSGYDIVILCDPKGNQLRNMKESDTYSYSSDGYSSNTFIIKTTPNVYLSDAKPLEE